jgi:membrane protein YdbS with pleckstrin-like domain
MKPHELFAVAIRVIGLLSLLYLLFTGLMFFAAGVSWQFVVRSILWALMSIWFLRGAPQLVRFAYPDER